MESAGKLSIFCLSSCFVSLTSLTGIKTPSHALSAKSLSKKSFPSSVFTNACLNIPFAFLCDTALLLTFLIL